MNGDRRNDQVDYLPTTPTAKMDNQFTKERINCVKGQWKWKLWRGRVMNAATLVSKHYLWQPKTRSRSGLTFGWMVLRSLRKLKKTWTRLLKSSEYQEWFKIRKERKRSKECWKSPKFRTFQRGLWDVKGNQALLKCVQNTSIIGKKFRTTDGVCIFGAMYEAENTHRNSYRKTN